MLLFLALLGLLALVSGAQPSTVQAQAWTEAYISQRLERARRESAAGRARQRQRSAALQALVAGLGPRGSALEEAAAGAAGPTARTGGGGSRGSTGPRRALAGNTAPSGAYVDLSAVPSAHAATATDVAVQAAG